MKWTVAEGAIYTDFDDRIHVIDEIPPPKELRYFAGVDWGWMSCPVIG